jgi:hypothetical protein
MAKPQGKPGQKAGSGANKAKVEDPNGDWYVYETFDADGAFAVGIREGEHDPSEEMLIADRMSRTEAIRRAKRHADEYRRDGGKAPEIIGM